MYSIEATVEEKKLATVGRQMMSYSEDYGKTTSLGKLTDNGLRTLNELSHVGGKLTRYGVTFGTSQKDFSQADKDLIQNFINNTVDIESK
jgi:hypothetical protein